MIHILFSASAAGTLRQLLRLRGSKEGVVDLSENLDWGPIADGNCHDRDAWFNLHAPMSFGEIDWLCESFKRFKVGVTADPEWLIWIAPRSAAEQSGLYWFLHNFNAEPAQMIIADYPLSKSWKGEAPFSLGELDTDLQGELLDECPRVPWNESRFPRETWLSLMSDKALLRVVTDGRLRSAPDDYFDETLLRCCPPQWGKWLRVIGDTMGALWHTGHSTDSNFLTWRLRCLILAGAVECDGDLPKFGEPSNAVRVRRVN